MRWRIIQVDEQICTQLLCNYVCMSVCVCVWLLSYCHFRDYNLLDGFLTKCGLRALQSNIISMVLFKLEICYVFSHPKYFVCLSFCPKLSTLATVTH